MPAALARYIAEKGSVCIDGTSLTVNGVDGAVFDVNIVPHTLQATTLGDLGPGSAVNIEGRSDRTLRRTAPRLAGNLNRNAGSPTRDCGHRARSTNAGRRPTCRGNRPRSRDAFSNSRRRLEGLLHRANSTRRQPSGRLTRSGRRAISGPGGNCCDAFVFVAQHRPRRAECTSATIGRRAVRRGAHPRTPSDVFRLHRRAHHRVSETETWWCSSTTRIARTRAIS